MNERLLGSKEECVNCPIFSYELSRQMVLNFIDGEVREHHLENLKFLTGKTLELYPKLGDRGCVVFCGCLKNDGMSNSSP